MAKTRQTQKLITEQYTVEEAEALFADYAKADAKAQKLQAELDLKITKAREQYQDDLARLAEEREDKFRKLQHFALSNPDLFGKKKSLEFTHGLLGFRTGNPALKTRKGYTWAVVLDLLKKAARTDLVRTKEEVNKEAILGAREDADMDKLMGYIGVEVVQDEAFYVEPKKEAALV
jgi:phage host-nuclease inhibitor protein Gam